MTWMRFCVLDVGQGSANYIEVTNDADELIGAAIVDIGSEQWKVLAGKPSAQWIAERLQTMKGGAALDAIVLSHSDSDHINLIPALLEDFDPPTDKHPTKPVLTIKKVFYAGAFAKYQKGRSRNFLDQLDDYGPSEYTMLKQLQESWSSFDDAEDEWKPLVTIGGAVDLWVVAANTTAETLATPKKGKAKKTLPDGFAINTRSIVVGACYAGRSVLATGDATGLTLAHCNNTFDEEAAREKLGKVLMVTLPHHGSDKTTYDLTGSAHGSDAAVKVVEKFSKVVDAYTISGSAGERKTFRHPSANVIADLGKHMLIGNQYTDPALTTEDQHFYTSYFEDREFTLTGGKSSKWPSGSWWYSVRTGENVYTTDYFGEEALTVIPEAYPWKAVQGNLKKFKPAPPRAISWAFDIRNDGTRRIEVARDRGTGSADYWEAVAELHDGPLPDHGLVWVPSAERMHEGVVPIAAQRPAPTPVEGGEPES